MTPVEAEVDLHASFHLRQLMAASLLVVERRHHLGGALGAAVFSWLSGRQWIAPIRGERAVRVTQPGVREFQRQLGIEVIPGTHR